MELRVNSHILPDLHGATTVFHLTQVRCKSHIESQGTDAQGEAKVGISTSLETEDDDYGEEALQEAIERVDAATQFPSWVVLSRVNRIRRLNCFELVREMILSGHATIEVARKVHELGEFKTKKLETVRSDLEHYKATIPSWEFAARQKPKQYLEMKHKIEEQINITQELCELYQMMKKRIAIGMATDAKFGFVQANLERNFVVAAALLAQIQTMRDRVGFGDMKGLLPQSTADSIDWQRVYGRKSVTNVMKDPDARARVVGVAERLFSLYGKQITPEQIQDLMKKQLPPKSKQVNEVTLTEEEETRLDQELIKRMNEG